MEPVVNGLEGNFNEQVQVRRLDVNSSEGGDAFRHYQLLGHPSYVLLNPGGVVLWKGLGEMNKVELEGQIQTALEDS